MINVAVVFLVTLHTIVVRSMPMSQNDCLYYDISNKFSDCMRNVSNGNDFNEMIPGVLQSDTVTEVELLAEISATCKNVAATGSYSKCAERVLPECPMLASVITDSVNDDVSVFCENDAPSAWLGTVLETGYLYKRQCLKVERGNTVIEMVFQCVDEADFPRRPSNKTVLSGLLSTKRTISKWFRCMVDKAPLLPDEDGDGVLECGSTWQDMVLTFALRMTAFNQLGAQIGPEEIAELKAIKMGENY